MSVVRKTTGLLAPVIELALLAGERIMAVYGGDFSIHEKADSTPVTEADIASHDSIVSGLAELAPKIPVLSEEDKVPPFEQRAGWEWLWLVDPLDGTREFIKRNDEFTVNIALVHQSRPVLGVIHCPPSGVTYYAAKGEGAYRQDRGQRPQRIWTRPWDSHRRLVVAGSRSHGSDRFAMFLGQFPEVEIIKMGSALKSCLVAEGKADVYLRFGTTSEWDTAAAQCIVEEAGGAIYDHRIQPLRYNSEEAITNPSFIVVGDASRDWERYLAAARVQ